MTTTSSPLPSNIFHSVPDRQGQFFSPHPFTYLRRNWSPEPGQPKGINSDKPRRTICRAIGDHSFLFMVFGNPGIWGNAGYSSRCSSFSFPSLFFFMTSPFALLKSTFFLRHGAFGVIVGLGGFVWGLDGWEWLGVY